MLIPRMTKTQRDAIITPVEGLLIYQTNSTAGFYYYNGSGWTAVTSKKGWQLQGNSDTDPATNFIGTTDAHPLIFKVNNLQAGKIDYASPYSTSFGYQTLKSNLGSSNSGFGYEALFSNTTGTTNTAVGEFAGKSNVSGAGNSFLGYNSGQLATGSSNTFIGSNSGQENTGSSNTFIGSGAGQFSTSGSSITLLGYNTAASGGVTNATALGANALAQASNCIVLGNGASVGIGSNAPAALLHVQGSELTGNGKNACIEIANTALNGGNWYMRAGATGTNTPAGGFSIADDHAYRLCIDSSGNIGIGVMNPNNKLDVCGTIRSKEVRVEAGWCDYVFERNYPLMPLNELKQYINTFSHLPEIPPASQVESEGLNIGENSVAMMKKIEELTLYVIQQDKEIKDLQSQIDLIKKN